MQLHASISSFLQLRQFLAGGPGSGCTGPNCGRPKSVSENVHNALTSAGFKWSGKNTLVPGHKVMYKTPKAKPQYTHPTHGSVWVGTKNFFHQPQAYKTAEGLWMPNNLASGKTEHLIGYVGKLPAGGVNNTVVFQPSAPVKQPTVPIKQSQETPSVKKDESATNLPEGVGSLTHALLRSYGLTNPVVGSENAYLYGKNGSGIGSVIVYPKTQTFKSYSPTGALVGQGSLSGDLAKSLQYMKAKTPNLSPPPVIPDLASLPVRFDLPSTPGVPHDHVSVKVDYSPAEHMNVLSYKGNSEPINKAAVKEGLNHAVVASLDQAIAKGVTNKDLTVYRGLSGQYAENVFASLKEPGSSFKVNSFQETSLDKTVSQGSFASGPTGVVLQINVPKGTPALATTQVTTSYAHEKGIIFARDVTYVSKGVYNHLGKRFIEVDLKAN